MIDSYIPQLLEKSDEEEDEKKDDEKSYHEESDEDPDITREREDAAKYIVETYAPVIVTVHQDSYIRFWTMEVCIVLENYIAYFSTKTYVVGTQKNRLNETVLLSTHIKF